MQTEQSSLPVESLIYNQFSHSRGDTTVCGAMRLQRSAPADAAKRHSDCARVRRDTIYGVRECPVGPMPVHRMGTACAAPRRAAPRRAATPHSAVQRRAIPHNSTPQWYAVAHHSCSAVQPHAPSHPQAGPCLVTSGCAHSPRRSSHGECASCTQRRSCGRASAVRRAWVSKRSAARGSASAVRRKRARWLDREG